MTYNTIKNVLPFFKFIGRYSNVREVTSGNVNNTFVLEYEDHERKNYYTLQHINTYVFKNPHEVMSNISAVTNHLRNALIKSSGSAERRVLELIKTTDGKNLFEDEDGDVWRAYVYIDGASALDATRSPQEMEEVGRGFGNFQKLLYDFPAQELFCPIPNFHHSQKRFFAFVHALDQDKAGRVKDIEEEIEFMFENRRMLGSIVKMLDDGTIPYRVTHNDTKSNNVLLDNETGKAICVIDLDTVMAGSVLYDYGDAIRFGASTAAEDEEDISKIALDMDKAKAFTKGFIEETNGFLTNEELLNLPLGIKVLTCELAIRFLTDYIDGDVYFKVNSPDHNLIRARAQIALFNDIVRREQELHEMTERYIARAAARNS